MLLQVSRISGCLTFAGSLTENVSAIVSGKASPHGKLEYILGGISAFCLILTTIWATVIIRSPTQLVSEIPPQLISDHVRCTAAHCSKERQAVP